MHAFSNRSNMRWLGVLSGVVFACGTLAQAQDLGPQNYEFGVSGGHTWFKAKNDPEKTTLKDGGFVALKLTENFANHFGLEQSGTILGNNALRLTTSVNGIAVPVQLGSRLFQFSNNLLLYGTGKRAAFRPFVFAGVGFNKYRPTDEALQLVNSPAASGYNARNLRSDTEGVFNYGAGLKARLSTHWGVRADVTGMYTHLPEFGLPENGVQPSLFIKESSLRGIQLSSGISYIFSPGPDVIVEHEEIKKTTVVTTINTTAGSNELCAGETITLHASSTGGRDMLYRWMVDGTSAGTGPDFTYTAPKEGGSHSITVETTMGAADPNFILAPVPGAVTVTAKAYVNPTLTLSADKSALMYGESTPLRSEATKGACNGNVVVSCTVTEGSITGTDPKVFDSNGVSFDMSNRGKEQSKQVVITCTANDDKGGSATATTPVTVTLKASAQRKYDVLFPSGSARVNNCGKRALIDEIAPALEADPSMTVVLVAHVDGVEKAPKMRMRRGAPAPSPIDQQRAEDVAAVLSAATGICRRVNPNQIKVKWVGSDQANEYRTPSCADSVKERRGAATTGDAKDRRVEVYLVPTGADMPPALAGAVDLPASVKALGCPK